MVCRIGANLQQPLNFCQKKGKSNSALCALPVRGWLHGCRYACVSVSSVKSLRKRTWNVMGRRKRWLVAEAPSFACRLSSFQLGFSENPSQDLLWNRRRQVTGRRRQVSAMCHCRQTLWCCHRRHTYQLISRLCMRNRTNLDASLQTAQRLGQSPRLSPLPLSHGTGNILCRRLRSSCLSTKESSKSVGRTKSGGSNAISKKHLVRRC